MGSDAAGGRFWGDAVVFCLALALGAGLGNSLLGSLQRPAGAPPDWGREATQIAETAVRQRLQNARGISFRNVRAHRFGPEEERGVCGEITMPHPNGGPAGSSPFVVHVTRTGGTTAGAVQASVYLGDSALAPGTVDRLTAQLCRDG